MIGPPPAGVPYIVFHQEDLEAFLLSSLPEKIVSRIVDKQSYEDYAKLEETCRYLRDICNSRKYRLPLLNHKIHIFENSIKVLHVYDTVESTDQICWHEATAHGARIAAESVTFLCRVTDDRMREVKGLFNQNGTTTVNLYFLAQLLFSPAVLDVFLHNLGVQYFESIQFMSNDFFEYPNIRKIEYLKAETNCSDESLLKILSRNLSMTTNAVSDRGLNRFLKQIKNEKRDIISIIINFNDNVRRDFDTVLEGLEANVIWTPDTHENSILCAIPLNQCPFMLDTDPSHFYSIWNSADINVRFLIQLTNQCLSLTPVGHEYEFLTFTLSADQFYTVTQACKYCYADICSHRRQYSTARFKAKHPAVFGSIIKIFQTINAILDLQSRIPILIL